MKTDVGREEKEVFAAYLVKNRLKRSEQREVILDTFLRSERHLSVDDLLQLVQKRRSDIGFHDSRRLAPATRACQRQPSAQEAFVSDRSRSPSDL